MIVQKLHILVFGVSGSGKSTVAAKLAQALNAEFIEGDDHHPKSNILKMSKGQPLTDRDRAPWLASLSTIAKQSNKEICVISCSALKKQYRDFFRHELPNLILVSLEGGRDIILSRIQNRNGHFMPASLLGSQLAEYEAPTVEENSFRFSILRSPNEIVTDAVDKISSRLNLALGSQENEQM